MKKFVINILLLALALSPVAMQAGREELAPGLWYEHTFRKPPPPTVNGQPRRSGPLALAVFALEVDPTVYDIKPVLAKGQGAGLENLSSIAKNHGAVAAINGGFYKGTRQNGAPEYTYKIKDTWNADTTTARDVLGWNEHGDGLMVGRVKNKWTLTIGEREMPIDRVNQLRRPGNKILYTKAYNARTLTGVGGVEIGIAEGKVSFINTETGNTNIPQDGCVYSVASAETFNLEGIEIGMPALLSHECVGYEVEDPRTPLEESDLTDVDYLVNGIPVLITGGEKVKSFAPEGIRNVLPRTIISGRHPRTAVGLLDNDNWLFVVVDGRMPQFSMGMTIDELADYMLGQGCVEAINLDGGSSAALFLEDKIINRPGRGRGARPVSDVIVVLPKES